MPTAVGPNTKGEENLVFGYDLGDVSNSYRGEPTVNYAPNPLFDSVSGYGNFGFGHNNTIETSTIPGALQGTAARIVKNTSTSGTIVGEGGTPVLSNGDKITVTYYVKGVGPSIGQEVHIHCYVNSSTGAISTGTTYPGAATSNWKRFSHTFTWTKDNTSYGGAYGYCRVPFSTGTEFLVSNPQIEINGHATPFVDGTRSATQGLLDFTGNSTIDLTNVSFDSNAQMTFDGTDDYVSLGDNSAWDFGQNGTIEVMVYPTNSTGNDRLWCIDNNTSNLDAYLNSSGYNVYIHGGVVGTTTPLTQNKWNHLVVTYSAGTVQIYINGAAGTMTGTTTGYNIINNSGNNSNLYLGCYRDLGYNLYGDLDLFKIYNRALTASEVKSNFNAIKGRFNIL